MSTKSRTRRAEQPTKFSRDAYEAPALVGGGQAPEREEVLLFSYQADENAKVEEFWVPTEVPRATSLRILELYSLRGEVAATIEMLKTLVGDRAYAILADDDLIEQKVYDNIVDACFSIVLGDQGKGGRRS